MKLSEEIRAKMCETSETPESVCYIEKHDGEGFKAGEIDGDYCHACATMKARELDREDGGSHYHQVYEESMPESEYFKYCSDCGCHLNAALIMNEFAEDSVQCVVDDLHDIKAFADIRGYLAWRIEQLLGSEEDACRLFPKQMTYIGRRLTNLYKKQKEELKCQTSTKP